MRINKKTLLEKISKINKEEVLTEQGIGQIARKFLGTTAKSVDEIRAILKTSVKAMDELDYFFNLAKTQNSVTPLDDLVAKVVHMYNPSGLPELYPEAKRKTALLLNAFAKEKGKNHFGEIKDVFKPGYKSTTSTNTSNKQTSGFGTTKSESKTNLESIFGMSNLQNLGSKIGINKLNKFEEIMNVVIKSWGNVKDINGTKHFVSASGGTLSYNDFKNIINDYLNNKIDLTQFSNFLPRQLKNGTEFRQPIVDLLKNK
jgi:hypothetical protein